MSRVIECGLCSEIMEACYKVYTLINRTLVMLMLEIFWKLRQISEFFNHEKLLDETDAIGVMSEISPLTKESKNRRHIRSMSDVLSSTPYYRIPVKSFRKNSQNLMYDSDTRIRQMRMHNRYRFSSSDSSSDAVDHKRKNPTIEENILGSFVKPADSMRYL